MIDMLPALLWCIDVVMALNIIGLCVIRGRLMTPYSSALHVSRVSWPVVVCHVVSALLGLAPYLTYLWFADGGFDADVKDFYAQYGWPSACVIILLIVVQILCMYLQAKRAMRAEMDERLHRAIGK